MVVLIACRVAVSRETGSFSSGTSCQPAQAVGHLRGVGPGRSVRPHPSRKSVSPATRRPSTRKHWCPGVWPGVCSSGCRSTDRDHVARPVRDEMVGADPGGLADPLDLVGLDVDRTVDGVEQCRDPSMCDPSSSRRCDRGGSAWRGRRPRSCRRRPPTSTSSARRRPGRRGRTRPSDGADRVHEVHHLRGELIARGEVARTATGGRQTIIAHPPQCGKAPYASLHG